MARGAALAVAVSVLLAGCGGGGETKPASASDAQACLKQKQIPVVRALRAPDDTDAPDTELIVGGNDASAFLGFYDDEQRAERNAPEIETSVTSTNGIEVERHGKLTIAWTRGRDTDEANTITDCVLSR